RFAGPAARFKDTPHTLRPARGGRDSCVFSAAPRALGTQVPCPAEFGQSVGELWAIRRDTTPGVLNPQCPARKHFTSRTPPVRIRRLAESDGIIRAPGRASKNEKVRAFCGIAGPHNRPRRGAARAA